MQQVSEVHESQRGRAPGAGKTATEALSELRMCGGLGELAARVAYLETQSMRLQERMEERFDRLDSMVGDIRRAIPMQYRVEEDPT